MSLYVLNRDGLSVLNLILAIFAPGLLNCYLEMEIMEKKMDEKQKREYQTVVLAALLHDIKKFMNRAGYVKRNHALKINIINIF